MYRNGKNNYKKKIEKIYKFMVHKPLDIKNLTIKQSPIYLIETI
jgi:hypothetical protein